MEFLAGLLVAGTFGFWALCAVEFILLIILLENEKYFLAPLSVLAVLMGLYLWGDLPYVLNWIYQNPLQASGIFAGYFLLVGAPYALVKWWSFVHFVREKNREFKKDWLGNWERNIARAKQDILNSQRDIERYPDREDILATAQKRINECNAIVAMWEKSNGKTMTAELLPLWKAYEKETSIKDWFGHKLPITKPEPDQYKGRIVSWIIYWPPSMFWTLLNDPIRKIGKAIYNWMAGTLKKISDHVWKDEDVVG